MPMVSPGLQTTGPVLSSPVEEVDDDVEGSGPVVSLAPVVLVAVVSAVGSTGPVEVESVVGVVVGSVPDEPCDSDIEPAVDAVPSALSEVVGGGSLSEVSSVVGSVSVEVAVADADADAVAPPESPQASATESSGATRQPRARTLFDMLRA